MKNLGWFLVALCGCSSQNLILTYEPVLVGGLHCPTAQNIVFQDATTWQQFWLTYCNAFDDKGSILPPPAIDFKKHTLVGVFLGQRPTGGYAVTINQIKKTKKELLVSYAERKPDPGSIVIMVIAYPSALVTVDKTELPVRFVKSE